MNLDEDREPEIASMAHWAAAAITTTVLAVILVAVLALFVDAPPTGGAPARRYDPTIHQFDRIPRQPGGRAESDIDRYEAVEQDAASGPRLRSTTLPPSAVLY